MPPAIEAVVEASQLVFSYGNRRVLNGLDLSIYRGEIFGLLGANGSGKTTLMRLFIGLLKPRSGSLHILGREPSPQITDRIGYMPQVNALYMELSVEQNLHFFARMLGMAAQKPRRDAVENALRLVSLWDRRKDSILSLSGGMRQRTSLAIALVHSPPLLVLDEPTVGLDPELRASFWDHFRHMAAKGATIVVSSHTMDDAAHCDRLVFLRDGVIIANGSPAELKTRAGSTETTLEDAFLYFVRKG